MVVGDVTFQYGRMVQDLIAVRTWKFTGTGNRVRSASHYKLSYSNIVSNHLMRSVTKHLSGLLNIRTVCFAFLDNLNLVKIHNGGFRLEPISITAQQPQKMTLGS